MIKNINKKNLTDEEVFNAIISGETYKGILNISDEQIAQWVNLAKNYISENKFEDAKEVLSVTSSLDPFRKDSWHLMSIVCEKMNDIQSASIANSFAISIDVKDPIPHIVAARLLHRQNLISAAHEELSVANQLLNTHDSQIIKTLFQDHGMSINDAISLLNLTLLH